MEKIEEKWKESTISSSERKHFLRLRIASAFVSGHLLRRGGASYFKGLAGV